MLEAILTKAVRKSVQEYAAEKILDPLGISNIEWWTDANGMINPGTALMTPRDMAKLGQLYLNEGMWQGRQLIPKAWLSEATAAHNSGGAPHYEQYGYQFWVTAGQRILCLLWRRAAAGSSSMWCRSLILSL